MKLLQTLFFRFSFLTRVNASTTMARKKFIRMKDMISEKERK